MTLSELRNRCQGELIGEDMDFDSVSTDSRTLSKGDVYLALSGERFDGHDFLGEINDKAAAFVLERPFDSEVSQVVVSDTRAALGEIAGFCRDQFSGPVVAITGSSGKTTARNMLAAIMRTQGEVCATTANENNEIGVPLTLLRLKETDVAAVIELGARHLGDITYLGRFVKPTVSILLNAGSAHIGEFGGYENIVKGKGEIYDVLMSDGVAIVNLDDKASGSWIKKISGKQVLTYSVFGPADYTASGLELSNTESKFTLVAPDGEVEVALPASGQHNVSNALAVAAAAHALNVSLQDIAKGLSGYQGERGRQNRISLESELEVIDDSYNANPASMAAALDVLAMESTYRIAILGEMGELGEKAESYHLDVADNARATDIEEFWLIGDYAPAMAERIGKRARAFNNKEDMAASLHRHQTRPATVLIKGSRFMRLEEVIEIYKRGHH